jgi:histone H3/H4
MRESRNDRKKNRQLPIPGRKRIMKTAGANVDMFSKTVGGMFEN